MLKISKQNSKGFTLLEILLVVGIIAILAGIVIIAINPARQLAQTRDTERRSDIKQLYNAMIQFYIDKGFYPASTTLSTTTLTEVCDTGNLEDSDTAVDTTSCSGLINFSYELVPIYITAIPSDPSGASSTLAFIPTAYAAVGGAGYMVGEDTAGRLMVTAPLAELSVIAIGTTTSGGGGGEAGAGCDITATGVVTPSTDGDYTIQTFTGDGTFTVDSGSCDAEVLVVAGGGGGGAFRAGGGGGGGYLTDTLTLSTGSIDVTVGDGGLGGIYQTRVATNGENSLFGLLLEAIGGGRGSSYYNPIGDANIGGSGGGGSIGGPGGSITGAAGTSDQGYGGGRGYTGDVDDGAGGGGAGGAGENGTITSAGSGGAGQTFYGVGYAGGGGGGATGATAGSATHGGGAGGTTAAGTAGTLNTGGGGGGSGTPNASYTGGDGGSGIVIVRYATN